MAMANENVMDFMRTQLLYDVFTFYKIIFLFSEKSVILFKMQSIHRREFRTQEKWNVYLSCALFIKIIIIYTLFYPINYKTIQQNWFTNIQIISMENLEGLMPKNISSSSSWWLEIR